MTTHSTSRSSLLIHGAAAFAFCICAFLHEGGHYLAYNLLGIPPRTGIALHPFGMNYNLSLNEDGTFWQGDPSAIEDVNLKWAIMGGAAPALNLLVGVPISLLLWKKRSPTQLPFLMIGPTALLIECFPMLEQATGAGGDWYQVIYAGVPLFPVVLLGIICLAGGCIWMMQLLPLAGVRSQDPFWRKLVVLLAGIPLFVSGTVFYQLLFGVEAFVPSFNGNVPVSFVVIKHLIELGVSIIIVIAIAALHRRLSRWLERLFPTPVAQVRWRDVLIAIGLAVVVIVVQLVFFNDPTVQVLT